MALIISDGDFTTAAVQGKPRRTYPFRGDTTTFYVESEWMQFFDNYTALALDTAHPSISSCYLVQESPLQDLGGGVALWTRTYSKIPISRVWYESYAYTVPGIIQNPLIVITPITSASDSGHQTTIVCTLDPSLVANNRVRIFFPAVDSGGAIVERVFDRLVVSTSGSGPYNVVVDLVPGLASASNAYIFRVEPNRRPFSQVVLASIHYDYYLPGVTGGITTVADIPILNPTPIVDQLGDRLDSYADWTTPSLSTYQTSVIAEDSIVAEASELHPWMGNIWERVTRYVTQI